jgi:hypothetical protein
VNRAPMAKSLLLLGSALVSALLFGCSTPAVGAPCLPEQVPEDGFAAQEAYVESSSVQCETRVCIVYQLAGDPRAGCVDVNPDPNDPLSVGHLCSSKDEIEKRVYCTCRCNSGNTGFAECDCPDGFSCVDVLEQGGPGVRGGYCVRDGTYNAGS